jgi:hypothetical protein
MSIIFSVGYETWFRTPMPPQPLTDYPTLTLTGTQSLAEVLSVEILKVVDVVLLHRVLY